MFHLARKPGKYRDLDEGKNVTVPVEQDGAAQNEGRWKKGLQHVRRYWYYYSPASLALLALVLVILFVVIIPAIVQNVVNSNNLPVHSASFLNPTPDSVQISLVSSIDTPSAITAKLMPLNLSLAGQNDKTSFTEVLLPGKDLKGNTTIEVTDQTVIISNMISFQSFLQSAMYSTKFTMQASGKTDTFLGAIRAPITLSKQIELAGLQNLTGFNLVNPQLLTTAQSDGTNLLATADIPNYSVVSLEIGNLTLGLAVSNITIGNATIENVFLTPGSNSLPIRASINLTTIAANINAISKAQPGLAMTGNLSIQATGQTTTFNGQRIAFYEKVLNSLVLTTTVPVQTLLAGAGG